MSGDEEANVIDEKKEEKVAEIAASSIRSGLAELELKTSQVLQRLENVRTEPPASNESSETSQVTTLLEGDRKPPSEILRSLEVLIAYSESEDDPEFPLPALDDVSHLALISHSIIAYMSHLDRQHLLRVTGHIAGDTTRWLCSLFRFIDGSTSFHTDNADATLRTVRLAIVARCPGYLEGGIPALANPCFYISENTTPMRLQYACRQLGIPLEAIRLIPSNSIQGTMDLNLLQKQVQADLNANRTPLLVIADVGSSVCGYVDNLTRMKEICKANNIWLHATGHGLASLVCTQGPGSISSVVDSIVLNLGFWLGVPSLPIALLHRQMQNSALTAFESDPIVSKRLNSLALWTSLQALGRETIAEKIHVAFQTCSILHEISSKCEGIRVVSRAPGGQAATNLIDIVNKPLDVNTLFETATSVVVFQFDGSISTTTTTKDQQDLNSTSSSSDATKGASYSKTVEKLTNASYYDRLNSWLGQIIQRDCPNFDFEIIEHGVHGTCIRYCPLELGLGEQPPSAENLENFAQSLESHVDILRATIRHKATFIRLVEKSDVLRIVNLPDWAGMGGVRFVPEGWESLLTDQAKTELNKLNADLVEALKSTDNAFSLGEGTDGLICVRFGMVTHDTDVEELLDLVVSVGKSVQENSRVLDTMSEIVKKGIEAATADLQRESDEKLWQEGILRHVPVVGRMVNWWSPPIKESGIKGRSLNLTQGVVESTENIYKYHMQMTGAPNQLPANKSPPTPMVQTPVGAPTAPPFATPPSANHSRTVSQSSGASSSAPELVAATPVATANN
ncbi:pyridoxal-dependent decarboxylase domain-containing protein 1 [Eupeodes corollae]|uniref:pyridoxal-dependent decarboxylase domain-containing protein 1 n=1 Tax=Eupeodes corollae TaxID=290404 RepID=UPI00248FBEBB|nr:pyridoxal-dependent decarboxylase domain-containing protein 1 [Eupeodes corollae]